MGMLRRKVPPLTGCGLPAAVPSSHRRVGLDVLVTETKQPQLSLGLLRNAALGGGPWKDRDGGGCFHVFPKRSATAFNPSGK